MPYLLPRFRTSDTGSEYSCHSFTTTLVSQAEKSVGFVLVVIVTPNRISQLNLLSNNEQEKKNLAQATQNKTSHCTEDSTKALHNGMSALFYSDSCADVCERVTTAQSILQTSVHSNADAAQNPKFTNPHAAS